MSIIIIQNNFQLFIYIIYTVRVQFEARGGGTRHEEQRVAQDQVTLSKPTERRKDQHTQLLRGGIFPSKEEEEGGGGRGKGRRKRRRWRREKEEEDKGDQGRGGEEGDGGVWSKEGLPHLHRHSEHSGDGYRSGLIVFSGTLVHTFPFL